MGKISFWLTYVKTFKIEEKNFNFENDVENYGELYYERHDITYLGKVSKIVDSDIKLQLCHGYVSRVPFSNVFCYYVKKAMRKLPMGLDLDLYHFASLEPARCTLRHNKKSINITVSPSIKNSQSTLHVVTLTLKPKFVYMYSVALTILLQFRRVV